jgi:hypothetical protein
LNIGFSPAVHIFFHIRTVAVFGCAQIAERVTDVAVEQQQIFTFFAWQKLLRFWVCAGSWHREQIYQLNQHKLAFDTIPLPSPKLALLKTMQRNLEYFLATLLFAASIALSGPRKLLFAFVPSLITFNITSVAG